MTDDDFNPRAEALRDGVVLGQYEDHVDGCEFGDGRSGFCTCPVDREDS